jgi:hypothetical protein
VKICHLMVSLNWSSDQTYGPYRSLGDLDFSRVLNFGTLLKAIETMGKTIRRSSVELQRCHWNWVLSLWLYRLYPWQWWDVAWLSSSPSFYDKLGYFHRVESSPYLLPSQAPQASLALSYGTSPEGIYSRQLHSAGFRHRCAVRALGGCLQQREEVLQILHSQLKWKGEHNG